jgi:putative flippase GtrA
MKLSIIIPVFNENSTLPLILKKIADVDLVGGLEKEVMIVDDFSKEKVVLPAEHSGYPSTIYKIIRHEENKGKGAAVRTGLLEMTGDFVVIQDADLEYDPTDYNKLLPPLLSGEAKIVYGSRFSKNLKPAGMSKKNYLANRFLTIFSNILTGMDITDMETCYKMMTREVSDDVSSRLTSNRFGIEPEVTALVKKMPVAEVPISYVGRTAKEGKKIGYSDGIEAIWKIIRFNFPFKESRIIRFIVSGAMGAATDLFLLWLLTRVFGIWYLISAIVAFILSFFVSFFLQKLWTFKDREVEKIHIQAGTYLLVTLCNLGINTLLVYLFVQFLSFHYLIAQILASILIGFESFFAYRELVFKNRPKAV